MKKDIYVIRNTVNDKCYVGQSVNYLTRFRKHKETAKRHNYQYKSALYDAMNEIGIDKFYVEPLERDVDDGDTREQYWIDRLNTHYPNGYNLSDGGIRYPNLSGVMHHAARITSQDVLLEICDELQNTDNSLYEIADRYGLTYGIVQCINSGESYHMDGFEYPLRRLVKSDEEMIQLAHDLAETDESYQDLARRYGLSLSYVKNTNYGLHRRFDGFTYPLRKCILQSKHDKDIVDAIIEELRSSDKSFDDIAARYGCNESTVKRINDGGSHKLPGQSYPIRPYKKLISSETLEQIFDKLRFSDESLDDIAAFAGVSFATIKRINNGSTAKYRKPEYTYPLRAI